MIFIYSFAVLLPLLIKSCLFICLPGYITGTSWLPIESSDPLWSLFTPRLENMIKHPFQFSCLHQNINSPYQLPMVLRIYINTISPCCFLNCTKFHFRDGISHCRYHQFHIITKYATVAQFLWCLHVFWSKGFLKAPHLYSCYSQFNKNNSFTSLSFNICSYYNNLCIYRVFRAANNGQSMDNVQSELGIDRTNLWVAGHVVRSLTDSLREILVFNYLIIMSGSIYVSQRKKIGYKTRQTSGWEISGCHNFHDVIKSCCGRKSLCLPLFYLL